MSERIFAVIDEKSPVYADIVRVFGWRRLPLESARLVVGNGPGVSNELFYKVDFRQLSADQIQKWAEWMAGKYNLTPADVLLDLADPRHGMPLRRVHVLKLEPEGTAPIYPCARENSGPWDARLFS